MTQTHESNKPAAGIWVVVATVGLLLVATGTLLPLLRMADPVYKYLYCAGALMVFVGRLFSQYKGSMLRVKRLSRIEVWSGIMFCTGGFFMFYKGAGPMDWLAFTLAGAVIQGYTSIMIPRTLAKEGGKK